MTNLCLACVSISVTNPDDAIVPDDSQSKYGPALQIIHCRLTNITMYQKWDAWSSSLLLIPLINWSVVHPPFAHPVTAVDALVKFNPVIEKVGRTEICDAQKPPSDKQPEIYLIILLDVNNNAGLMIGRLGRHKLSIVGRIITTCVAFVGFEPWKTGFSVRGNRSLLDLFLSKEHTIAWKDCIN